MASGVFGALGLATSVGTSAVSYLNGNTQISQNSQLVRQSANNTLLAGQYSQQSSYRNAESVKAKAQMKIEELRRDLHKSKHKLGSYSGVSLDSGSVVDSKNSMEFQEKIDEQIILYNADQDARSYMEQGDMALWKAAGSAGISLSKDYYRSSLNYDKNAGSLLTDSEKIGSKILN